MAARGSQQAGSGLFGTWDTPTPWFCVHGSAGRTHGTRREVVVLGHYQGLTFGQIAEVLAVAACYGQAGAELPSSPTIRSLSVVVIEPLVLTSNL